jgi:hypothetical protein
MASKNNLNSEDKSAMDSPLKNRVLVIIFTILIAFPLGFVVGNLTSDKKEYILEEEVNYVQNSLYDGYEVPESEPIPTLDVNVSADKLSGWNLKLETANFEFKPDGVSENHAPGEGYAMLYVDGIEAGRVYAGNHHLKKLGRGTHFIEVVLHTNDHREYQIDSQRVSEVITVNEVN